ncbi:BON domain-containing protein [Lysobacter niabensis]|uniref:BON domain-containing protein n=1 Tax=Agrilutibacter niabensis TaxID=380628 RepID=UPI00361B1124
MNHRNDDDHRYQSGQRYSESSGGQRESTRQGRVRHDYDEQSDRSRAQQAQASRSRGEYYGGEQFDERSQSAGWNEDGSNWDYEGGPERYTTSGFAETDQDKLQNQRYGRQQGAQFSGRREYGSQNTGASDYYSGRQGYGTQGSFGSEYNTYGRNQGHGETSGYTRSQPSRGQPGRQFATRAAYGGSPDYLDEGEMSGYGEQEPAPQSYATSSRASTRSGSFRGVGPRNYTRSDERLTEDINERLTDDDDLDPSDLSVHVSQGKVTLEGKVEQRWMKHRAEDIADSCIGVKEVENRIQVISGSVLGQRATGTRTTSSPRTTGAATTGTSSPAGGTTPH